MKKSKINLQNKGNYYSLLSFERPIAELEKTIKEMENRSDAGIDLSNEIKSAKKKLDQETRKVFQNLTPWQRVQVARHPLRPYTLDYIGALMENFVEVHGDRHFADDRAIITGFAKFRKRNVCVVGHQKGRDTKENLMRSFGSAHPEGYRKAIRVMRLAEKFSLPIISLIDTPGAYPGIGAEERGQAEAIAFNIQAMSELKVPIIVIVIGEGGSGGALGIGVGDHIIVLENAYYSVISPEGCAAILWKDNARAEEAAKVLRLTGNDLLDLGVIDEVVKEPLGGAHRDFESAARNLGESIENALKKLSKMTDKELLDFRYQKFRRMGAFEERKEA
ncbi:MAG: acetyl-CoA carboxylase carboxyltransferase subunit alpha [Omnitrophica bacterium RIFCSPLOWO2_12_FULL_44_17]|uniref:Acetyl-coenzyme A carboxylase carboxyl transferase subunit alpha n=1 Tax=Candidatus Danuiimicrobium aquiferis TaxID=1801832 RepID=A0A1G1L1S0_9BACT|nr:MAG: acetyl-CoA carboxylase carboxyltransferase subunit alpha [Omnitrophica bacterium RIFCSPHIGHO2_02_FULL_45_28]OGW91798.1 MAG: acetyl-CoA carboxylase carboxyltransferase subunit alpha [Omnitrophica bacterium RIFCSPHIGHO2_12_FULL_44_12]OGW99091.1 MAG: acetyl-CoA carboxylase carboxyltransferase subunit alpha [Omnitrophica bacterium RIFCSPLOWO2_12_FULL_44_17]OGX04353.1 MAG: acetyl-CoA carboxylase carboxyltransferase subunit alpha [Omnitrophica bacterium RIFCSPLOWO2_02_FULL_44_11]